MTRTWGFGVAVRGGVFGIEPARVCRGTGYLGTVVAHDGTGRGWMADEGVSREA